MQVSLRVKLAKSMSAAVLACSVFAGEGSACNLNVNTTTTTPVVPVSAPVSVRIAVKNVGSTKCNNVRVIDYWMSMTPLGAQWTEFTPSMLKVAPSPDWKYVTTGFPVGSSMFGGPPVPSGDLVQKPVVPLKPSDPALVYKGNKIGNAIVSALNCAIAAPDKADYQALRSELHKAVTWAMLQFPPPSGWDVLAGNVNARLASKGIHGVSCAGFHVY